MRKSNSILIASAVIVVALGLTGCSATGSSSGSGSGPITITALLPQGYDQPYGSVYVDTMKSEAKKLGVTLTLTNSKYDAATQASDCNVAVAKKPSGIILWPADATAVRPCLLKAKAAGIPVTSSNSDVLASDKSLVRSYSGPSNTIVGQQDADLLGKALNGTGGIVIVQGQPGNSTATDRQAGFEAELKAKFPGITILGAQPANWDKGQAVTATSELYTRYGSQIKGIYAQDDTMAAGAIEALRNRGIDPSSIPIVGCGNTKLGRPNIISGAQYGTMFQSPIWDGQHAIDDLVAVIKGKTVPTNVFMPMPLVTKANATKYPALW